VVLLGIPSDGSCTADAPAAVSPIKGLVDVELAYVDLLYALAQI
jgi:hypothetical protein